MRKVVFFWPIFGLPIRILLFFEEGGVASKRGPYLWQPSVRVKALHSQPSVAAHLDLVLCRMCISSVQGPIQLFGNKVGTSNSRCASKPEMLLLPGSC